MLTNRKDSVNLLLHLPKACHQIVDENQWICLKIFPRFTENERRNHCVNQTGDRLIHLSTNKMVLTVVLLSHPLFLVTITSRTRRVILLQMDSWFKSSIIAIHEKVCCFTPILHLNILFASRSTNAFLEFVEYEPYYFQQIRCLSGVEDEDYIAWYLLLLFPCDDIHLALCSSFMKTIKERLTEGGASGAFFFFTKDEKFIAKSCTFDEINHIRQSSFMLSKYFEENPESFITRL